MGYHEAYKLLRGKGGKGTERIFHEIMAPVSSSLMRKLIYTSQKLNRLKDEWIQIFKLRCIIIKLSSGKERLLKAAHLGSPGGAGGKELACQCRKHEMWDWSLGQESPHTHSSILVWRIPWTEEPGGLWSIESQRIGHDWSNLACTHAQSILSMNDSWLIIRNHWG